MMGQKRFYFTSSIDSIILNIFWIPQVDQNKTAHNLKTDHKCCKNESFTAIYDENTASFLSALSVFPTFTNKKRSALVRCIVIVNIIINPFCDLILLSETIYIKNCLVTHSFISEIFRKIGSKRYINGTTWMIRWTLGNISVSLSLTNIACQQKRKCLPFLIKLIWREENCIVYKLEDTLQKV
jgi:hypothetical protein